MGKDYHGQVGARDGIIGLCHRVPLCFTGQVCPGLASVLSTQEAGTWQAIQHLLGIGTIEPVPLDQRGIGVYSHLFTVPKRSGDARAILILKWLNKWVRRHRFKMELLKSILLALDKGDFQPLPGSPGCVSTSGHSSFTREIPQILHPGPSLPVLVICPSGYLPNVYKGFGGNISSLEAPGHNHLCLSGQHPGDREVIPAGCRAAPQAPALLGGSSPVSEVRPLALVPPGCSTAREVTLGRDGAGGPAPCGAASSQAAGPVTAEEAGLGYAAAGVWDACAALGGPQ